MVVLAREITSLFGGVLVAGSVIAGLGVGVGVSECEDELPFPPHEVRSTHKSSNMLHRRRSMVIDKPSQR